MGMFVIKRKEGMLIIGNWQGLRHDWKQMTWERVKTGSLGVRGPGTKKIILVIL